MKTKFLILVLFFCAFAFFPNFQPSLAFAEQKQFARVLNENAYLYKNPVYQQTEENVFFLLEKTYFVQLYEITNDYFYKASYMGIDGYVLKSDVRCVAETPQTPYANSSSFRVYAQNGLTLRSSPTTKNGMFNKVATIPFLDSNLQYVGKISAEESVAYRGSDWFFCRYFKGDEQFEGYVYAGYCDMLTPIAENLEVVTYIDYPIFQNTSKPTQTPASGSAEQGGGVSKTAIIVIVTVSLPALLILFLIFRPSRALVRAERRAQKQSVKTKIKRAGRHSDYYEMSD